MSVSSIRLQKDLEQPLNELCKRLDRSRNWLVNQAIREFIENQALQEERWTQTVEALSSVERGEVVPAEEVHAWLKTWGQDSEVEPPAE
jgi:predicted transcriptional regulator